MFFGQKFVPVTVTVAPAGTFDGETLDTVGVPHQVTGLLEAACPPDALTVITPAALAEPGGDTAVKEVVVELEALKEAAGILPKDTAVTPMKFEPVMTTVVPPATEKASGLILDMIGAPGAGVRVNALNFVLAPPVVVIVTSYVPAASVDAATAVTDVDPHVLDTTAVPIFTETRSDEVVPKLVPVSVIVFATPAVPGVTETFVNDGRGLYVN